MDERERASDEGDDAFGVGLAEALEGLRAELASAHVRASGSDFQFPVESLTVELKAVVKRSVDGKAGFRVPVVGAELGGSGSRGSETVQTVTLQLAGPVDREGRPQRVAGVSDEEKR